MKEPISLILVVVLTVICLPISAEAQTLQCAVTRGSINVFADYGSRRVVARLKKGAKFISQDGVGGDGISWLQVTVVNGNRRKVLGWTKCQEVSCKF